MTEHSADPLTLILVVVAWATFALASIAWLAHYVNHGGSK